MEISNILFVVIFAGLPILLFGWYMAIISRDNKVREARSTIGVQLKQRLDLIPNVLRMAQRFMDHEKSLLNDITKLRTRALEVSEKSGRKLSDEQQAVENMISSKMGQLMVQVENYPELKSDQTMVQAMNTYNEVESRIAASRRFYNASVTSLNTAIQIFPGGALAKVAGVTTKTHFEAGPAVHQSINVDDYLGAPGN